MLRGQRRFQTLELHGVTVQTLELYEVTVDISARTDNA